MTIAQLILHTIQLSTETISFSINVINAIIKYLLKNLCIWLVFINDVIIVNKV